MITPQEQGNAAELAACRYLEAQGLTLVEKNYRCASGELDLIMRHNEQLVFVEVRCRRTDRYGTPAETITKAKQQRLLKAANHYLQQRRCDAVCRFDVIAITQVNQESKLKWIQNAFQAM